MADRRRKKKKNSNGLKILCAVLFVILIGLIAAVVMLNIAQNERKANIRSDVAVEAGSTSVDAQDFLKTPDGNAVTFVQGVTQAQLALPGKYPVQICWNGQTYDSVVRVVDTVKPTATGLNVTVMGEVPDPQELVKDIIDVTQVTVSYKQQPDISAAGTQQVTVVLTDTSGNTNEITATITVIVDEQAPEIIGVTPFALYLGDTISYRAGITVKDDHDPAPDFRVDSSAVDLSKIGEYKVIYTAVDAAGNEAKVETTVDVREKKAGFVELEIIYEEADKVLTEIIKDGMTKREKARAIYDWIRDACWYANHSDKSDYRQGAYAMLKDRKGDCFNYYALSKLLLERAGIDTIDVRKVKNYTGDSDHYWSLVSLDGGQTWYHFDATPRVGDGDNFFLVTDKFLDAYSNANKGSHNRDKSLYPATPEN